MKGIIKGDKAQKSTVSFKEIFSKFNQTTSFDEQCTKRDQFATAQESSFNSYY